MNKQLSKTGPGRRTGAPDTRQAILDAAHARFAAEGFTGTTVRSIAADAGVDAAMINYFFGSKQKLFEEALALRANPVVIVTELVEGSIEGLPRRILTTLLATWDDPANRPPLIAIVTSIEDDPAQNGLLRDFLEKVIAGPVAAQLTAAGMQQGTAEIRAGLLASMFVGVVMARYVVRASPMADLPPQVIVDELGPALDAILAL
ncbi:TetR/AcrR family transcriptional regulator [Antrihabitans stalagmiti]|nr:TetR family transcriptional regulator [Antrihabitans stalagmiti]